MVPGKKPTTESYFKSFRNILDFLYKKKNQGLIFVRLDLTILLLLLISYASFENAEVLRRNVSYTIITADGEGRAKYVHYRSKKYKRIENT